MPTNNNTIIHIVGNRPQFIKLAVLHKEIQDAGNFNQQIVHTGQHYSSNMSAIFFEELAIPEPTINFNIQNSNAHLFIGQAAEALQQYFTTQQNAIAFVYGDTNTTLAAAMAAKKVGMPLFHFEAGVRTYDNTMPEETNRILTDRLADVNYCCTKQNLQTMVAEGYGAAIPTITVFTGDLMLDAFVKIDQTTTTIFAKKEYVVATIHREANLASHQNLTQIIASLNQINESIPVIMPMHPHTQKRMADYGLQASFTCIDALGYPDMKNLLSKATYVITDSGGTSREAYFMQKKSLIIMDTPFWPEIIFDNCALHAAADKDIIRQKFDDLKHLQPNFGNAIFGNGNAAHNIVTHLTAYIASQ